MVGVFVVSLDTYMEWKNSLVGMDTFGSYEGRNEERPLEDRRKKWKFGAGLGWVGLSKYEMR